jgi:hypothetical protein
MKKRLLSLWMALALLISLFPAALTASAEEEPSLVTGQLTATLRFDCPQLLAEVQERQIKMTLNKDNTALGTVFLSSSGNVQLGNHLTEITAKNKDGAILTTEAEIGYFDAQISGLPLGTYTLTFEGSGYKTYTTPDITLDTFSRQVILGTGDATFTIGDIDQDGGVTTKDRNQVANALGKTDDASLAEYDLNGDGKIDIIDLVYVNHQIDAEGSAKLYDTALIASRAIDTGKISEAATVTGNVEDLFTTGGEPVKLASKSQQPLEIPLDFSQEVEIEQIKITSPAEQGAVQAGTALVEYSDGTTGEFIFGDTFSDDVQAIGEQEGKITVTIPLGKRVAVKKITIIVTKTEGGGEAPSFAVLQSIQFLKDIVPEKPVADDTAVKNIQASSGNEKITLKWSTLSNVTGYKVRYGTQKGIYDKEMIVDTPTATVSGLKNLTTYYFVVVPISGQWEGTPSDPVEATPMPTSAPRQPDSLNVTPLDSSLKLTWGKTQSASYYKVYYREKNALTYQQFGEDTDALSMTITGLKNGTEYTMYVVAGNDIGLSNPSDTVSGIPAAEEIDIPTLPVLNRLDNGLIEEVKMTNPNNVAQSFYPEGFQINNVIDGDFLTHWTARTWSESHEITYTFKEAKEMNYAVYVPRLDGAYRKSLSKYTIKVWDEEGNLTLSTGNLPVQNSPATTGYAVLPFPKSYVKKIAIDMMQWEGSPTDISLCEMAFYEYDGLAEEIRALFKDDSYTGLTDAALSNAAATQQVIDALLARANDATGYYVDKEILIDELNLAASLLKGDTSALGLVKTDVQSRNAALDTQKYNQSSSTLQPLGAAALANTSITIYAQIPEGETISLVASQYFAQPSKWQSVIPLTNGRNVITIPKIGSETTQRGGALYLSYSGQHPEQIQLQVRGTATMPVLELSDWYQMNENTRRQVIIDYIHELQAYVPALQNKNYQNSALNVTELSMPNVLLSLPANQILSAISPTGADETQMAETLYNNVLAWEELMHIANTTQGIDNTLENSDMQSRQNIRYMRMSGDAFMYAAGNHVGIGYGSAPGLACGKPVSMLGENATANQLFGWGIAHEIGHNMDKLGKAEITNNIYSLMVQTYDGKENTLPSRLEGGKYAQIFQKTAAAYPGAANDVFVQLGMYWQLHLAYDPGEDPMQFYNTFFKLWKSGEESGQPYEDRFALLASKTANKNLEEFFTRWGMQLKGSTKQALAAYPEETRSIYYLNDQSRRYRLSGGAENNAATTASAALNPENEKQVTLSISNADPASILGYEISRNGKGIGFTTETTYTDNIGSANNMAFTYTVRAVDLLGNRSEPIPAGEVRISYDKTLDPEEYTLSQEEDGSILITLKETTAVSGIKLTGTLPAAGAFEVSVKQSDSSDYTIAKKGDFSKNDATQEGVFLNYFNKPGTEDTRIWTYDAKKIKITGLPEDATVELLGYVGDNIAFYPGASIGKLKQDYRYGDGEEDVIAAGTLVITGTYRGNPLYNTIQIKGRFVTSSLQTDAQDTTTERALAGEALLFAEIPEDGAVSTISDGFFLFIPDVQKEAELQNKEISSCELQSLLPAWIKAELYRTDTVDSAESKRLTSDTVWITSPSEDSMPDIVLE